jgi:multidrug efflux pump subunit AcrA (membrane-fusion protein)
LDNTNGKLTHFTILQYDREDFIQFNLNTQPKESYVVDKGDTIARIYSSDNQIILSNLKGELKKARANLAMASTGEKAALQEEARQALKMSEIQFNSFVPQYQRKKDLYEKNLIGAEEWEIARSTYNLYQSNINKEQARLQALESGEKQEMIYFFETQIDQIQSQIELMKGKLALESIRSPMRGILTYGTGDSIICRVDQIDTLILQLPVPAEELKYISLGQNVSFYSYETGKNYIATIINIGKRSRLINNRSMYMINAIVENSEHQLAPSMTGYAKIHCEKVTILTQLNRAFNRYLGFRYL